MKKIVMVLIASACLGLPTMSASAASSGMNEGTEVNLDPLMEDYKKKGSIEGEVTLGDSANSILRTVRNGWVRAGGGLFKVAWGVDRHYSYYNHPKKVHRSSASNSSSIKRSIWENPGKIASVWIKSSLWGNKANWATK
ncbi:lactococcin 972 family bacteriocin [Bacillus xiapuensis]|uniref:lactococcin 972 family bacteriocin n=1 Tax=Bacillus xiapuensis TaxID=2014075 RepID=UPI000C23A755|nr:lactococcin 972 family bacteriocin [Bacillus xiapuensis]